MRTEFNHRLEKHIGELPLDLIATCRIFRFGTLSMTRKGVRAATLKAIRVATDNGCLISFAPQPPSAPVEEPGGSKGADRRGPGPVRYPENRRQ